MIYFQWKNKFFDAMTSHELRDFVPGVGDEFLSEYLPTPKWELFIRLMFVNDAYNIIINLPDVSARALNRLEAASTVKLGNPDSSPDLIIRFFNELISSLPIDKKPSVEAIEQWNQIATNCTIDIIFNDNGLIEKYEV